MRLVLSPEETPDSDDKVLLAGSWCLPNPARPEWHGRPYDVVPYHWATSAQLAADYGDIDQLGERLLSELVSRLNALHGTAFSPRFWRMLTGRWILHAVPTIFDRMRVVTSAIADSRAHYARVAATTAECWVPPSTTAFVQFAIDHPFNRQLFARLLQIEGSIELRPDAARNEPTPPGEIPNSRFRQRLAGALGRLLARALPPPLCRTAFWSVPFSTADRRRLHLGLRQGGVVNGRWHASIGRVPVDWKMRAALAGMNLGSTAEARAVASLVPELLPREAVETFAGIFAAARRVRTRTRLVLTGSVLADPVGQLWAALQVEQGAKLVCCQHGGHYGSGAFMGGEDHELRIADAFFSWGWTAGSTAGASVVPLPAPKLNEAKRRMRVRKDGHALLVLASMPRYAYWIYSAPQATQVDRYVADQRAFLAALPAALAAKVVVRLYPADYGQHVQERIAGTPATVRTPASKLSFAEDLNQSRLMIGTYNATTYLETLAADFPTLLFWNFEHWPIRAAAQPDFDALVAAGILHGTPQSAAAKLAEVFDDVEGWWRSEAVQSARRHFVDRHARTSPTWVREWRDAIRAVAERR